jgi:alkanesulfonate monooxygenase
VGTPEQVADALVDYVRVGASTLLIRGYDPYDDAVAYGDVITAVREQVEREGLDPAAALAAAR